MGEWRQQVVQKVVPYLGAVRVAVEHPVVHVPRLVVVAPTRHLHFEAVVLRVHARGEYDGPIRHFRPVVFAALHEGRGFDLVGVLFPRLAEDGVHPRLQRLGHLLGLHEGHGYLPEVGEGGVCLPYVEPCGAVERRGGNPLACSDGGAPLRFRPQHTAVFARILRKFWMLRGPFHVRPLEHLLLPAVGAGQEEETLVAVLEGQLDARAGAVRMVCPDGRGRTQEALLVPESRRTLPREVHRVAFRACGYRVPVHFVAQDYPDGAGCERGGTVRTADRQMPAREFLVQDGVVAEAALHVPHTSLQSWSVAQHRGEAVFGPRLPHVEGRLHDEHRRGVLVDEVPHDVVHDFCVVRRHEVASRQI